MSSDDIAAAVRKSAEALRDASNATNRAVRTERDANEARERAKPDTAARELDAALERLKRPR